jgi:hypothetical protein
MARDPDENENVEGGGERVRSRMLLVAPRTFVAENGARRRNVCIRTVIIQNCA